MFSRIAVLQPAYLGDVVFVGPLTRALAVANPGARIWMVVRPPADAIASCLPGVGGVVMFDKRGRDRGLSGLRRVAGALRDLRLDLVVSVNASPRAALLASLCGAPERLGPAEGPLAALYSRTAWLDGLPFVERSCELARQLGAPAEQRLELCLPGGLRAQGRSMVPLRAVALIPGSEWETKRWPVEQFAKLAQGILDRGQRPVLLGAPAERSLCGQLDRLTGGRCLDFCGNTVAESLAILSACEAAIGGDSGLTHAARALGIRTITIFGPTTPESHRAAPADTFLSSRLPCAPCSDHGARRCPLGHHRCLRELEANIVLRSLSCLTRVATDA